MKPIFLIVLLMISRVIFADNLPVFSLQPANQTVSPGGTATLVSLATGATSYQWRFNGADISGATGATLQVANAQTTNGGYYNVIAKNATGWVPSQLAYLSLDYTYGGAVPGGGGTVPFSNVGGKQAPYSAAYFLPVSGSPINTGSVQVVAGPELDQMKPIGAIVNYKATTTGSYLNNGYYRYSPGSEGVPSVAGGQVAYYSVLFTYTNSGAVYTQPSAIISVIAGGNGYALPSVSALKFPASIEWPEPTYGNYGSSSRNPLGVPGETIGLVNNYSMAYTDFGIPYGQWRKDGKPISGATNYIEILDWFEGHATLTITNVQASDAGVYDFVLYGDNWMIAPKIALSIQTTNGQGVFQKPKFLGTNFVCDLLGAVGRNYKIQQSTNLLNWSDLVTLSNVTGTVTFTNPSAPVRAQFYRPVLLP